MDGTKGPESTEGTESTDHFDSALAAIEAKASQLSGSERKVAEYVLANPRKTLHYNVNELARQAGASQAAVVRFCKRLGLGSFNNFKLRLARDVFHEADERFIPDLDLESAAPPARTIQTIIARSQRGLAMLGAILNPDHVERAAQAILAASSVTIFGVGASGVVASDFLHKLLRVGIAASHTDDTDLQVTAASMLRQDTLAFIISYSGEHPSMVEAARQARARGATVITLTMDGRNTLRALADIALPVPASERIYREGAVTSRINQLTVIDILHALIVSRTLDSSIDAIQRTMAATHRPQ